MHYKIATVSLVLIALFGGGDDRFIPVLDHANLAFHEAGHVLLAPFGRTLMLLGGTLSQCAIPVAAALSLRNTGRIEESRLAIVWLLQNLRNVSVYMADAIPQRLHLVGGGEHDWYLLFRKFGVLDSAKTIASAVDGLAIVGLVAMAVWAVFKGPGNAMPGTPRRYHPGRSSPPDSYPDTAGDRPRHSKRVRRDKSP